MKTYTIGCMGTALLFLFLFFQLQFAPVSFINDLGLQASEASSFVCRRASVFMLGLSVLLFLSRKLVHSSERQFICLSTSMTMIGLAIMGSIELISGTVNSSILIAIITETTIGLLFSLVFFRNLRKAKNQIKLKTA